MQAIKQLIKGSQGLEIRLKCSGGENSNFKQLRKKNLNGLQGFFCRLIGFFICKTKQKPPPPSKKTPPPT